MKAWGDVVYFVPILPLAARALVLLPEYQKLRTALQPNLAAPDRYRSSIGVLAGFSVTGIITIVSLQPIGGHDLSRSLTYLLLSFLGYLSAFNLQGYKLEHWVHQVAEGLTDFGSFCLLFAITYAIVDASYPKRLAVIAFALGVPLLSMDVLIELFLTKQYYRTMK